MILLIFEPGKCMDLCLIQLITLALSHLFSFFCLSISFPFCSYILHNVSWDLNIPPLMLSLSEVWACTWCLNVLPFISWRSVNLVWLSRSVSLGFFCLRCCPQSCSAIERSCYLVTFIHTDFYWNWGKVDTLIWDKTMETYCTLNFYENAELKISKRIAVGKYILYSKWKKQM